jgi:hypothetical protein
MRFQFGVLVGLTILSLTASSARSLPFDNNLVPAPLDSGRLGQQGSAVDISGNLAIVGAPFSGSGSAAIFDLTTGDLLHTLTPSVSSPGDYFGYSVAIDGDLAIVASGHRNAAYVFDTRTGSQLHILTPTAVSTGFVRSVDISNGIAILGVPDLGKNGAIGHGAAFLYSAQTGTQIARFEGSRSNLYENFGGTVAIDGDTFAVIAPAPSYSGRADVYVYDTQTGALRGRYGNSTTGAYFIATDVVIDGESVIVGGSPSNASTFSSAYLLDSSTGNLLREINVRRPTDHQSGAFVNQLDVSGDRLVVGSWEYYDFPSSLHTGAVHSFSLTTGNFQGTLLNPRLVDGDRFGFAVALENDRLVVGAPNYDVGPPFGRGIAYSYYLAPEPTTSGLFAVAAITCLGWRNRKRR